MEAIKTLKTRQSQRKFLPYSINLKVIEDIVDCGRLAASARNLQPWHFVVIDDKEIKNQLATLATNGSFMKDCGVVIAVFCRGPFMVEDGSAATQNILNAATAHGLGSCWVAGNNRPYAKDVADLLSAPKEYKLISLIAIGVIDQPHDRPAKKPLEDIMSYNKFE